MLSYFALFRLPQWTALPRKHRRVVWERCIHPLLTRRKAMSARAALFILILVGGGWFGAFGTARRGVAIVLSIFLADSLLDTIIIAGHRQQVAHYIQEHATEIQSAS